MSLTNAQQLVLEHLRRAYIGPEQGQSEVTFDPPVYRYTVGMLFPSENKSNATLEQNDARQSENNVLADVVEGDVEEDNASTPLAEDWRPTSTAISFVSTGTSLLVDFEAATYEISTDEGPRRWTRHGHQIKGLRLSKELPQTEVDFNGVPLQIGSRWREYKNAWLITVHARVLTVSTGDMRDDIPGMLFQVELSCRPTDEATVLPYDVHTSIDSDQEAKELRLRYRNKKVFAVGHGMAADWELDDSGDCRRVFLDPVPHYVSPSIEQTAMSDASAAAKALDVEYLAAVDADVSGVTESLSAFVDEFEIWVEGQESSAHDLDRPEARDIAARSRLSVERMRSGIEALRRPENSALRTAFSLAMAAMRLQMMQTRPNHKPMWRPFQLGFLLVSLESTTNDKHEDRDLVDLIWFPTGGGKTEAYLALAAVTIFLRRLLHGSRGAGTAVITRYTLRLLTAQQFQRASALICAMEILRHKDSRARNMAPFTIGLWVGNDVTPGTRSDAKKAVERMMKARQPREANMFQISECPWCSSALLPEDRSDATTQYGIRRYGNDIEFRCLNQKCVFSERELPLVVVDEMIYEQPPTFLLATVDKFARLQFNENAGKLLGLGTPFVQPSMIIQDELHLLSGPLGTTVAVFDAVIQLLLSMMGCAPKIVASTATIRASNEQVQGLYGRKVALYPPAGLDDDTTFFAKPVNDGHGRMYVGLMPQSIPQATALVAATAPFLEIPQVVIDADEVHQKLDPYWTLVMYHNSLRELGRTSALLLDDVNGRLDARAQRLNLSSRQVGTSSVLELTSRKGPDELPNDLRQLGTSKDEAAQSVDVVLSSNMLSVGIDVQRLALMLMVGQPKTTAEYIQATSRVGRGNIHGIVGTLFRSNRARDRSHFETFRSYHEVLYRNVEPTSVTPWSLSSRGRSLPGALVALLRHTFPELSGRNDAINLDLEDLRFGADLEAVIDNFIGLISRAESSEEEEAKAQIWQLLREWDNWARKAREAGAIFGYERRSVDEPGLLKRFGQEGPGWLVGDSMRSVEPNVAVEVEEPLQEASRAEN